MTPEYLHPDHFADLRRSGLTEETIRRSGFTSLRPANIPVPGVSSALKIPYHGLDGKPNQFCRLRLYPAVKDKDGHTRKYHQAPGTSSHLYFPPLIDWQRVASDPTIPIVITEGEKKAAAGAQAGFMTVGAAGVWSWITNDDNGGKMAVPDFSEINWKGRTVEIVPDSDAWRSKEKMRDILSGFYALAKELQGEGAHVVLVQLPERGDVKVGFDDWLVAEGSSYRESWNHLKRVKLGDKQLKAILTSWRKWKRRQESGGTLYQVRHDGIYYQKNTTEGVTPLRISNFTAEIVETIRHDDGSGDSPMSYKIKGQRGINGQRGIMQYPELTVTADRFGSLRWVQEWGPGARLSVGNLSEKHFLNAIKEHSEKTAIETTVYQHTGFRRIGDNWVFLDAQGAWGSDRSICVELPKGMQRYVLGDRKDRTPSVMEAVRCSLSFLELGPLSLTIPLLASAYLAPLTSFLSPRPGFSLFLHGESGVFKTAIALLLLSHFGDFVTADELSNFSDTSNALERRAFTLKDMLMLLDDFHPSASPQEALEKERLLQRLVRAAGNRTGRARLNADTTEKRRYEPRGLLVITGEDMPTIQSTLARLLIVDVQKGAVNKEKLTDLQSKAGLLPVAMRANIEWLIPQLDGLTDIATERIRSIRAQTVSSGVHPRITEAISVLSFAWSLFLEFAGQTGAVDDNMIEQLRVEGDTALTALGTQQGFRVRDEDPALRFVGIINALLLSKKACLHPVCAEDHVISTPIGEPDGDRVNFLPIPTWHEVRQYCRSEGTAFPVTLKALTKLLVARGWLLTDPDDKHLEARRTVFGKRCRVLCMPISLFEENGERHCEE